VLLFFWGWCGEGAPMGGEGGGWGGGGGGGGSLFHLLIHNVPTFLLFSVGCVTEVHSTSGRGVPNDANCLSQLSTFSISHVSRLKLQYVFCLTFMNLAS
jgi:hypothetical protein